MIEPFSESVNPEQNAKNAFNKAGVKISSEDSFYATGSSPSLGDDASFSTPLWNKEKITLSFDIVNSVQMHGRRSCIYYFNPYRSQWNIPTGSVELVEADPIGGVPILGPLSPRSYSARYVETGNVINSGSNFIEDAIGFDAYGFQVASGSLQILRTETATSNQTIRFFGENFNPQKSVEYMTGDYPGSPQRLDIFSAKEEFFTVPIETPFLIEKVVVDIPFEFGTGWFSDRTTSLVTGSSGSDGTLKYGGLSYTGYARFQDEGGPGLTLSLMCQKMYGSSSIRDLVAKSFITHEDDANNVGVYLENAIPEIDDRTKSQFRTFMCGVKPYTRPDIVVPNPSIVISERRLTGSLSVKMTPQTSNGIKLFYSQAITSSANVDSSVSINEMTQSLANFMKSEYLSTLRSDTSSNSEFVVSGIDVCGRGATGFASSGGSVFGREYPSLDLAKRVPNPFRTLSDQDIKTFTDSILTSNPASKIIPVGGKYTSGIVVTTPVFLTGSASSPYMIRPNDKLILAITKKRPTLGSLKVRFFTTNNAHTRGHVIAQTTESDSFKYYHAIKNGVLTSSGHDIKLSTGTLTITLYGSYVRENREVIR